MPANNGNNASANNDPFAVVAEAFRKAGDWLLGPRAVREAPPAEQAFPPFAPAAPFAPDDELVHERDLRKGNSGNDVRRLQTALHRLGLYKGEIDGIFGPDTENAVKKFQEQHGLDVDGIVGPQTVARINEALRGLGEAVPAPLPAPPSRLRLSPEGRREVIENLQHLNAMLDHAQERGRLTEEERQRFETLEHRKHLLLLDLLEQEIERARQEDRAEEDEGRRERDTERGEAFAMIVTPDDKTRWENEENVRELAKIIMSETSGKDALESSAVGYVVLNRMKRNKANHVINVQRGFAHNQEPTEKVLAFARRLLSCEIPDNSQGATHFYSPQSMPVEGGDIKGDIGGGLEQTPGLEKRNYRPSWTDDYPRVHINGIVEKRFKFYRAPGTGPVQ